MGQRHRSFLIMINLSCFDIDFCNAVKHIFISQMKRQGTELTSTHNQEGQPAFLFSLRSLQPQAKRKLDIQLDFSQKAMMKSSASGHQTCASSSSFDPSSLLPCFSKGSETKFNAFCTVSDQLTFQSQNIAIVGKLIQKSLPLKEEKDQIMQARPRSSFCQICKETFADYLKHLQHPVHIKKFEAQYKNSLIEDLIKNLETKDEVVRRSRPNIPIDDQECNNVPCKIRVIQLQDTLTPMRFNASSLQMLPK